MTPFALLLAAAVVSGGEVNYLTVDVRTRQVVEQHWPDADTPIPLGSLVKPFTALAYGGEFPEFVCKGTEDRCWLARGHGKLRFREALAQSCNAYFLNLARAVDPATLAVVAAKFGLPAPAADTAEARIGLGRDWQISPIALARAYAELVSRRAEPKVADILAGLALAAQSGTANAIGRAMGQGYLAKNGYLAKTGTAPCVAAKKHTGDGFALVLYPAEAPRTALLVQVHGAPGAVAAKQAALILQRLKR